MRGIVEFVNISLKKGTPKAPVPRVTLTETGIEGDAHAGTWHRQVSLLGQESIEHFARQAQRTFGPGEFAENLTTRGVDLLACRIGDRLHVGDAELDVTQIGKTCHGGGCAVFHAVGTCIMPKQGIFARVLRGGVIEPGTTLTHEPRPLDIRVVTLSDRASRGEYDDLSGPAVVTALEAHFQNSHWRGTCRRSVLPDEPVQIANCLREALKTGADVIFTTGGTGLGPRDCAPEVIAPMLEKHIPGIMEAIRVKYGQQIPSALLSRSLAGTIGTTLVYALPGSLKAVQEYMQEILLSLDHALHMVRGIDTHG